VNLPVSLACVGDPEDTLDWSGITHLVHAELLGLGHDPVWIDARPSGRLLTPARRAITAAHLALAWSQRQEIIDVRANAHRLTEVGAWNARLTGATAAARRRSLRAPAEVIQLRGDFVPARDTRTVIFEDITVAQVAEHRSWTLSQPAPPGLVQRRVAHQARAHRRAYASGMTSLWVADSVCRDYGVSRDKVHIVGLGAQALADNPDRCWDRPVSSGSAWTGAAKRRRCGESVPRGAFRVSRR
jgi:hypothetical protein